MLANGDDVSSGGDHRSFSNPFASVRGLIFSRLMVLASSAEDPEKTKTGGKKVVVGGGTGFIGTELCSLLRRKGYDVVAISRTPGPGRMTWDDLGRDGFPARTTAVVNLAGQNVLDPLSRWNPAFKKLVHESRVGTAGMVRDAVLKSEAGVNRPEVYVQVTGVGFYPTSLPLTFDEDSVVDHEKDGDFMSRLVRDWEAAAELPAGCGTRSVVIRSGVVLGRNGGMISNIFLPFYFGLGGRMGSGTQLMPWIHVKDLAGLTLHAVEDPEVKGVLNGVAPEIDTNSEFVGALASSLGRPALIPVPAFVWDFVFGPERASMILSGQRVVPKRTLESGFKYRFPTIKEACNELAYLFYSDPDQ